MPDTLPQPWFLDATSLARGLADGHWSSLELLDGFIERIERFDPAINAVVVRDFEAARECARVADATLRAGGALGPLHGVPMTVKESFDVAGLPSTFGHPERRAHRAAADSLAVTRLKQAGAIVFGKTNVPKYLGDWQAFNEIYGHTVNPWDHGKTPGGSSGGAAAALAAGMTALEIGSDIGGSIRMPAHFCGVFGHKPTFGIVPMRGHEMEPDLASPDMLVAGPMGRSATDLALAMDILAIADPEEEGVGWRLDLPPEPRKRLDQYRVAVITGDAAFPVDADTARILEDIAAALRADGAEVISDPRLPLTSPEIYTLFLTLLRGATSAHLTDAESARIATEVDAMPQAETLDYATLLPRGLAQGHRSWLMAADARERLCAAWRGFFADIDLLIAPVSATAAYPHVTSLPKEKQVIQVDGTPRPAADTYYWIGIAASAYLPATSIPAGVSREGLPIGVQIIGPQFHDRRCLVVAQLLERAHGGFVSPPAYK